MQMMHADGSGFLVPLTVQLCKSCARGTGGEHCLPPMAATFSNISVLPCQQTERGHLLLPACVAAEYE